MYWRVGMLSDPTLACLSKLTYQAEAKSMVSWLPLAGIYWEDEMPEHSYLRTISEDDRHQIYRLFGIRTRIWKRRALSDDQQQLWNETRLRIPGWAVFHRLSISADLQQTQDAAQQDSDKILEVLNEGADEITTRWRTV
jgi:hypothetical protein